MSAGRRILTLMACPHCREFGLQPLTTADELGLQCRCVLRLVVACEDLCIVRHHFSVMGFDVRDSRLDIVWEEAEQIRNL